MGRRGKSSPRCVGCRMHPAECICAAIPSIATPTRLALVIHRRELKKPTNTGILAVKSLRHSALLVWGDREAPLDRGAEIVGPGRLGLVLTPSADARVLDRSWLPADRHLTLVVPDGSWRQALKMPRRIPALAPLQRVVLPAGPPSRYRLREETRDDGLATLEAIARALGILDGPEVQRQLEAVLDAMVEATLRTRGLGPRAASRRDEGA